MQRFLLIMLCSVCAGCFNPAALQVSSDESAEAQPEEPAAGGAPRDNAAPAAEGAELPIVKARVVDKQAAMAENPNLRETENAVNAGDPLSAATQSYFAAGSNIHLLNFKHQIDIFQAQYDRYPTFDEFAKMFQVDEVDYGKGLKPWQMYAYDSSDGTVCLLEDREIRRIRSEANGVEYEE